MKLLTLTSFLVLVLSTIHVAAVSPTTDILPISSRLTTEELRSLRRLARGCNANVCFAIDGSASISSEDFVAQKTFVADVVAVLGFEKAVEVAAVQYGNTASRISRLTVNRDGFLSSLFGTTQLRSARTAVARGINFCIRQLQRRSGEANKIVLLGDGRSSVGSNAVRRADFFRSLGGEVCTVGAGFADDSELLAIAGGDPAKVFEVENFIDVLNITFIIEELVLDICGDIPEISGAPTARDLDNDMLST